MMNRRSTIVLTLSLWVALACPFAVVAAEAAGEIQKAFSNPPNAYRPMQIIHGFDGLLAAKYPQKPLDQPNLSELLQAFTSAEIQQTSELRQMIKSSLLDLQARGMGGVVCNVSFRNYLKDENQWDLFTLAIDVCREIGFRVWIYDEDGYPSAAAGGRVLEVSAAFEAQELVLDATGEPPYTIRASYEGTHASNNYYMARRYPNLIDQDAITTFTQVTHDAYAQRVAKDFGGMIEAFFTDEPSLLACNLGPLPDDVRKNVRVADPLDPVIERLPAIPWVHDLLPLFQERYGYDLEPKIPSLFAGLTKADQEIRRDFWALIATLVEERFFGTLQDWCAAHGVASSGHALWEEEIVYHTPLNGNILRNLQRMHIPGIDVLSSTPGHVYGGYSLTATLAASAAALNGTRRVMTETSDFSERMAKKPVSLEQMCATAAWQFALGVTDFTLYYPSSLAVDTYKPYNDFTGRLGALLTPAERRMPVALYYPISDLWAWYLPKAEKMNAAMQPDPLQKIAQSFQGTTSALVRDGFSPCLADHDHLAEAKVQGSALQIGAVTVHALVLPAIDQIPKAAQQTIDAFIQAGGLVVDTANDSAWGAKLQALHAVRVESQGEGCLHAEYTRNGKEIVLLVNTQNQPWQGTVQFQAPADVHRWDFASGTVEPVTDNSAAIPVSLQPFETIALVNGVLE